MLCLQLVNMFKVFSVIEKFFFINLNKHKRVFNAAVWQNKV